LRLGEAAAEREGQRFRRQLHRLDAGPTIGALKQRRLTGVVQPKR
jgi:hypothetical protein